MVVHAEQRIAHAKHDPLARRRRPVERPVGPHLRRQIHDVGSCARASPAAISGVGRSQRPASGTNAAFSSNRLHARAGVQHQLRDLVLLEAAAEGKNRRCQGVLTEPVAPSGTSTLKNRARTGANETVFCSAVLRGMLTTLRKLWPSSLASTIGPGRRRTEGETEPGERQRHAANRLRLCELAIWIHALLADGVPWAASWISRGRRPRAARASTVPPLEVTVGFSAGRSARRSPAPDRRRRQLSS